MAAAPAVDASFWHAVAGASVQIPPPNSAAYYFPQGHLEQYGAQIGATDDTLGRPFILCRVVSVDLSYHPLSEQPIARILLQPETSPFPRQQRPIADARDDGVVSYSKVLTPSDANNGGGFSVPRSCADLVFPPLDFSADPPVQTLLIQDAKGFAWDFRHIYRGTPRRHLLTTGWSKYVNAKRLIAGESVVFVKKPTSTGNELFVGVRRGNKVISSWKPKEWDSGSPTAEAEALEAMENAAKGVAFAVVYYPRIGLPDFVVAADKVEEAYKIRWCPGMRVKMEVDTDDSTRKASSEGTIMETLSPADGPWKGSLWKTLRVTWDEPDIIQNKEAVNPWDVEHISPPPYLQPEFPPAKRFKHSPDHPGMQQLVIRDGATTSSMSAGQGHIPSRTFTQLLTDSSEPDTNLYSEVVLRRGVRNGGQSSTQGDDEAGSSSGSGSGGDGSFRLFGKTIMKSERK